MRWHSHILALLLALVGCSDSTGGDANTLVCDARAPVCSPACGPAQICDVDCTCEPAPACDPGRPVCSPACTDGLSCLTDCSCGTPGPPDPGDCDPDNPVCADECGPRQFCASNCTCAPMACDPDTPACAPACAEGQYCTRNCMCAPEPCDADNPTCDPGCDEGQTCNRLCACETLVCDPARPVCAEECGPAEFCNARCACEPLCDPASPRCDPGCDEDEFCGRDCLCLHRDVCDPERPVCDPGCADGKICGATCECIAPCDADSPVCVPPCSPLERCNDSCTCELRPCDPDSPVCETECAPGDICGPSCLCQPLPDCDPRDPVCEPACADGEFCANNCNCYPDGTALPDLIVDPGGLINSLFIEERSFAENHCALVEGCVLEPGFRRLLRFNTVTPNIGNADMYMGNPAANEDLFEYSDCHGHYHFVGYAQYLLLDARGQTVAQGRKQAFCLLDSTRYLSGEDVPTEAQYNCGNQGITRGWADIYGAGLDCQWIDITDVAPGAYELRVSLNNNRTIEELSYENNVATTHVIIPAPDPLGPCDFQPNARGAGRDCGWEIGAVDTCTPGEPVATGCADGGGCGLGNCTGDPVMRVCAGQDASCTSAQALGISDDACGGNCALVNFVCPPEGVYTVLTGGNRPNGAFTCDVQSQLGHVRADPTVPCVQEARGVDRNCSWTAAGSFVCEPGGPLALGCNAGDGCGLGSCEGDTILRVCDGHENRCLSSERIGTNDDACNSLCSYTRMQCPDSGVFTTMDGAYRSEQDVVCNLEVEGATRCETDALEPNDDPREPPLFPVGSVGALQLCRGEREYYTVFANEPDRISITMDIVADDAEVQIEIFDPAGEPLESTQGAGPQISLDVPVGDAGQHRVSLRLLQGTMTQYRLTVALPLDE